MKNKIHTLLILLCLLISSPVGAQIRIGGLIKKAKKKVDHLGNFKPGTAITTSLKDTLPGIAYLDAANFHHEEAKPLRSFKLPPGYYEAVVRSYCLHAGKYNPTSSGLGYQIAGYEGSKTELIQSIIHKSDHNPEIPQRDIQTLIWGIEAGQKFTDYPLSFQAKVKPILSAEDIAAMEVNTNAIVKRMVPKELRPFLSTYRSIRREVSSATMDYARLEQVAVKMGVPPIGPGSVRITKGVWSYIGNGFFMRAYPENYKTTYIELYRPEYLTVEKDQKGRVTSVSNGENKIFIQYNDQSGEDFFQAGKGPKVPIWRIKQVTLQGAAPGQTYSVQNRGWIYRGTEQQAEKTIQKIETSPDLRNIPPPKDGEISYQRILKGLQGVEKKFHLAKKLYDRWQEIEKYVGEFKDATHIKPPDYYFNETYVNIRISQALQAALNPIDFKGKRDWIFENMIMIKDLLYYILCNLSGTCDPTNNVKKAPACDFIAQPGNTNSQRLAIGCRVKKGYEGLKPYKGGD